ncbi:hypothetical protein SO802_030827 [Lithocarpus litseifolius]|uniref:Uncharacterized protein n=1 Tax=Lithocarpus litseifolius TaxID=425828 RepID=A0AAW2BII4_9ROSI
MASIVPHSIAGDRDLDDADFWGVINSSVASNSSSKSRKSLAIRSPNFQSLSLISNPSSPSKLSNSSLSDTKSRVLAQGEVKSEPWVYRPPWKVARTCALEASETNPLNVLKNVQRTPTTPVYSSLET